MTNVFYKTGGYRYVDKEAVKSHVRAMGFTIRPAEDITLPYVEQMQARDVATNGRHLISTTVAFGPIFVANPHLATHITGIVEQTSQG